VDAKQLIRHIKALNLSATPRVTHRARNYLTQSLKKLEWSPTLQPFEGGVNIFAQRQGTDPQAGAVLVAAHYDTVQAHQVPTTLALPSF